ncbi:hypothetical protein D3C77_406350 [compost metagenome]
MTAHLHTMTLCEINDFVRVFKRVFPLFRLQIHKFHLVLCSNAVEMIGQKLLLGLYRPWIYSSPNLKAIGKSILQLRFFPLNYIIH